MFDPKVQFNQRGYDWSLNGTGTSLPLSDFYIANPTTDTATTINAALSNGEDVLLEPGAYSVTAPLTVPSANEVIFGLGEATVTASTNTPTIIVNDAATGTILAGFDANGLGFNATHQHRTIRGRADRDRQHAERDRLAQRPDHPQRRQH